MILHPANKGKILMRTITPANYSRMFLYGILSLLFVFTLNAQTTTIQLPTSIDTNSSFRIITSTGFTLLRLNADGGFYFAGKNGFSTIPATGEGVRLMWYPGKVAFRVGFCGGTQWDDVNVGNSSIAMGYNTIASGYTSTAMGYSTTASGASSTAMGYSTTASANYSTAIGAINTASGYASTAMGGLTTASGYASTAMGWGTTASGNNSTAIGYYVSTNNYSGSCIIGDSSAATAYSDAANQMTMRFTGGYKLFTNTSLSTGVYMNAGAGAWSSVCDRNKKENFSQIDGEQILSKIKEMPITEWNYKGTDKSVKYIGPVAQDFYAAFHLGGTDSLGINTICIDGVNIAAIQALEKRTAELQKANIEIAEMKKTNSEMQKRMERLENIIASMTKDNDKQITSSK
jgi:hypothetical protein